VKGQKKKKKTNDCSEVVFNIGSLNTDNLKNQKEESSLPVEKIIEDLQDKDVDIDDNIVLYAIE